MSEWRQATLGEVVALRRGHDLPTQHRRPGGVPVVGSFGITGWHDEAKASAPGVTLGRSGASFGTAVFVSEDYWPLNTCLYATDFHGNDPRWVYHMLDLMDFSAHNSGSAQPSLNRNFLAQIPVQVPPLDEQRSIAAIFEAFDNLIETNGALAASLEEEARQIWRYLASAESPPAAALADCANVILGGTPSRKNPSFWGGHIPWLNSGVANDFRVLEGSEGITREGYDRSSTKMVPAGATLIAITGATLGQVTRTEIEACGNQSLVGVYADNDAVLSDHLYLAVSDNIAELVRHATGGAQQHVNKGNVEQMLIPLLTEELRSGVEVSVSPLLAAIGPLLNEARDLTRTRDELLPLLMSGRVRVEDVEGMV